MTSIEEQELRDPARQMLTGLGEAATRDAAWAAIREAGWPALMVPEAQGGLDQPFRAATWLYQELGRSLSAAPLLPSLLAAEALNACPESKLRDTWLERIAVGEAVGASLMANGGGMLALNGAAINGRLEGVQNISAQAVLIATADLVALVPLDTPGVQVTPRLLWDETRDVADVEFSDVALDGEWVLARGEAAIAAFAAVDRHLHFALAADCVGAAEALLDMTVDYLKQRRQFDRPVAMFQAIKHRCADLKVLADAARAFLDDRLGAFEAGEDDPVILARAAKSVGSRAFRAVAEDAIQLHGGMGMTSEHPAHRFLKRALLNEHLASGDDACDIAVGQHLLSPC